MESAMAVGENPDFPEQEQACAGTGTRTSLMANEYVLQWGCILAGLRPPSFQSHQPQVPDCSAGDLQAGPEVSKPSSQYKGL